MFDYTVVNKDNVTSTEKPPGIPRSAPAFTDTAMICHFRMDTGASIPLAKHEAAQTGGVISRHIRCHRGPRVRLEAVTGKSYVCGLNKTHDADVLANSDVVESFTSRRPEFTTAN